MNQSTIHQVDSVASNLQELKAAVAQMRAAHSSQIESVSSSWTSKVDTLETQVAEMAAALQSQTREAEGVAAAAAAQRVVDQGATAAAIAALKQEQGQITGRCIEERVVH